MSIGGGYMQMAVDQVRLLCVQGELKLLFPWSLFLFLPFFFSSNSKMGMKTLTPLLRRRPNK